MQSLVHVQNFIDPDFDDFDRLTSDSCTSLATFLAIQTTGSLAIRYEAG